MNEITLDELLKRQIGQKHIAPGLSGIKGYLELRVAEHKAAMLRIDDGSVELTNEDVQATASADFVDDKTLVDLLRGTLNPVVAALRGVMDLHGDRVFVVKSILGLQTGKPFDQAIP